LNEIVLLYKVHSPYKSCYWASCIENI